MCSNWYPRMEERFTLVCQVYWHNTLHALTTTLCGFCTAGNGDCLDLPTVLLNGLVNTAHNIFNVTT